MISVITVNYNNAQGLDRTIKSVLSQDYSDKEFIIIDGGSSDGSVELISEVSSSLSYYCSEKDEGVFYAMNKGLEKAKGDYVIFMNSGDVYVNERSLQQLVQGTVGNPDFVYGNIYFEKANNERREVVFPDHPRFIHYFTLFLPHQATLTKRKLFIQSGGYDLRYRLSADSVFIWDHIINKGSTYSHVNAFVSICEHGGLSTDVAKNDEVLKKERLLFLKEKFPLVYEDYLELHELKRAKKFAAQSKKASLIERVLRKIGLG
jgi:glycosyltransferase involved in cell wall biosynthesis